MRQRNPFVLVIILILIGIPALGLLRYIAQRPFINSSMAVPAPMISRSLSAPGAMKARDESVVAQSDAAQEMGAPTVGKIMPPVPVNSGFVPGQDRTIIKTANLSLVVNNPRSTVDLVSQVTTSNGGVVTSSNIYESFDQSGATQAQMVLRVPVDKLDDTLAKLRKLGTKILQDSVNSDDRTKQKVDLQAQLKNLRATEEQMMTIMKQAKTVQETLEVQRELTSIRSQIEVMDAELQNLTTDAAMSTISVSLSSKTSDLPTVSPQQNSIIEEITLAFKDMIRVYRGLFISGIRSLILLLPLIVLGVIGWFIWQRKARKS
jgi:hypothetical protein